MRGSNHAESPALDMFVNPCPCIEGSLLAGAYLAALGIEHSRELVATDGDFARFPGCGGTTFLRGDSIRIHLAANTLMRGVEPKHVRRKRRPRP